MGAFKGKEEYNLNIEEIDKQHKKLMEIGEGIIVMQAHKVIFHVDELGKWKLLLKNVSNLLEAVDINKCSIEVLANSEAVKFYASNFNSDKKVMEDLNSKGVKFVACNNALIANNIKKDDLIHFIEVVPVGVLELVIKQSQGYAYIKP